VKIIHDKELYESTQKEFGEYNNTDLYQNWYKIKLPIQIISNTLFLLWAILLFRIDHVPMIKPIMELLAIDNMNIINRLKLGVFLLFFALFVYFIMTIVHEFTHILAYIQFFKINNLKQIYIVLTLPASIGIFYWKWITKKHCLFGIVLPFLLIFCLSLIYYLIIGNGTIFSFFFIMNLSSSSSDIFAFFYILLKIPPKSFLIGNYYRE